MLFLSGREGGCKNSHHCSCAPPLHRRQSCSVMPLVTCKLKRYILSVQGVSSLVNSSWFGFKPFLCYICKWIPLPCLLYLHSITVALFMSILSFSAASFSNLFFLHSSSTTTHLDIPRNSPTNHYLHPA